MSADETDETTTEQPKRVAGMRNDDEMQVGNKPDHAVEGKTPADADQEIDRGSSVPVAVDMPDPVEPPEGVDAETVRGTVPDVIDPAIEGDARDRRSETILQEGVSYADKDRLHEAPYEATQGFSRERLIERDKAKAARLAGGGKTAPQEAPHNEVDSGDKKSNDVQADVEAADDGGKTPAKKAPAKAAAKKPE